jgi:hypothetical protein
MEVRDADDIEISLAAVSKGLPFRQSTLPSNHFSAWHGQDGTTASRIARPTRRRLSRNAFGSSREAMPGLRREECPD